MFEQVNEQLKELSSQVVKIAQIAGKAHEFDINKY